MLLIKILLGLDNKILSLAFSLFSLKTIFLIFKLDSPKKYFFLYDAASISEFSRAKFSIIDLSKFFSKYLKHWLGDFYQIYNIDQQELLQHNQLIYRHKVLFYLFH